MNTVWVIERDNVQDRRVVGVADSLEAAVLGAKAYDPTLYARVWWGDVVEAKPPDGTAYLIGKFVPVAGKGVEHEQRFNFSRYTVGR